MTMFDKKLYVETFSALHASEDTLAEIRKLTSQTRKEAPHGIRPAGLSAVLCSLSRRQPEDGRLGTSCFGS